MLKEITRKNIKKRELNDNELKQEKYAHDRQMKLRAQIACATKPPMTPGNNVIYFTHSSY